jgi:hypothetical protein
MGKFGDLTVHRPAKTMLGDAGELLAAPDLFDNGWHVSTLGKSSGTWEEKAADWDAKCRD